MSLGFSSVMRNDRGKRGGKAGAKNGKGEGRDGANRCFWIHTPHKGCFRLPLLFLNPRPHLCNFFHRPSAVAVVLYAHSRGPTATTALFVLTLYHCRPLSPLFVRFTPCLFVLLTGRANQQGDATGGRGNTPTAGEKAGGIGGARGTAKCIN